MPPLLSLKAERDKKATAVISTRPTSTRVVLAHSVISGFANSVADRITKGSANTLLTSDLLSHILTLPITLASARLSEFDTKGAEIWNLSTRLNRSSEVYDKKTLCLLRVFAFNLLDSAHHRQSKTSANCVRLLRVAFKAAKFCLVAGEVELSVKVLERAAAHVEELSNEDNQFGPEDEPVRARLTAEYYVLRTTLVRLQQVIFISVPLTQGNRHGNSQNWT
jgi:hypothetical protein